MCTAVTYLSGDHYFGRNLDYFHSYGEEILITPRNFPLEFSNKKILNSHFAIIGMGIKEKNYPLYFDATNEKGLSMAGLLFKDNAFYQKEAENKSNIASFEFIPWVLSQCKNLLEAKALLENTNITDDAFSPDMPPSPLHWIISDKKGSITVEAVKEGIFIYDNPIGVLTNNPPFPMQMFNLNNYMSLSTDSPKNSFSEKISLSPYSPGMGALGLPGDLSSSSRFVRAVFTKLNSSSEDSEESSVSQFFHILNSVEQTRGLVKIENSYEITLYSSCTNTDKGIYYYKKYDSFKINSVNLHDENLNSETIIGYQTE